MIILTDVDVLTAVLPSMFNVGCYIFLASLLLSEGTDISLELTETVQKTLLLIVCTSLPAAHLELETWPALLWLRRSAFPEPQSLK